MNRQKSIAIASACVGFCVGFASWNYSKSNLWFEIGICSSFLIFYILHWITKNDIDIE